MIKPFPILIKIVVLQWDRYNECYKEHTILINY